jgi:predicted NUDIX family NTP pyrophosphohydrolase
MKISAGLLMYRVRLGRIEFLLAHPGGPVWRNKDAAAWTIPKGEIGDGEDAFEAAKREFAEELGFMPKIQPIPLTAVQQKGGKIVHAWAFEGDFNPKEIQSNLFEMEWPPRSGRTQKFPEIDRAEWFDTATAKAKINPAQIPLLEEAEAKVRAEPTGGDLMKE